LRFDLKKFSFTPGRSHRFFPENCSCRDFHKILTSISVKRFLLVHPEKLKLLTGFSKTFLSTILVTCLKKCFLIHYSSSSSYRNYFDFLKRWMFLFIYYSHSSTQLFFKPSLLLLLLSSSFTLIFLIPSLFYFTPLWIPLLLLYTPSSPLPILPHLFFPTLTL